MPIPGRTSPVAPCITADPTAVCKGKMNALRAPMHPSSVSAFSPLPTVPALPSLGGLFLREQKFLDASIVDTQKFVCSRDHVDTVRLAFGALAVK